MLTLLYMVMVPIYFAISVLGLYALVLAIKALRIYIDKNEKRF